MFAVMRAVVRYPTNHLCQFYPLTSLALSQPFQKCFPLPSRSTVGITSIAYAFPSNASWRNRQHRQQIKSPFSLVHQLYSVPATNIRPKIHFTTEQRNDKCAALPIADSAEDSARIVLPKFQKQVAYWLLATSGMVLGMVLLGGYTRLSGSGLSMTDWSFGGRRMPSGPDEWEAAFNRYKDYPEYKLLNYGMTVDEFRFIYFVEWLHRMMGRMSGVVFGAGALYFAARKAFKLPFVWRLLTLFSLGGAQGFVGWWMVKSGLNTPKNTTDCPRVSPYRLSAHLVAALTLYVGLLWNALTLLRPSPAKLHPTLLALQTAKKLKPFAYLVAAITATTIVSGALVAGNDAGHAFNTWPKMNGGWIPVEVRSIWEQKKYLFENTAVVQFNHRMLAYVTFFSSLALHLAAVLQPVSSTVKSASALLPLASLLQATLGIVTLLTFVPTELGVAHQGGAMVLLTTLIFFLHSLRLPVASAVARHTQ